MPHVPRLTLNRALGIAFLQVIACHPYGDQLQGAFNAGSADPFNFPPAYRSSGGSFSRETAGSGTFNERRAFAHGVAANYFVFPFPPSVMATTGYAAPPAGADPLRVAGSGALPAPLAFQFEPTDPVQDTASCSASPGYHYDPFRDDVQYDRQGNVISALPTATFGVGALPTWSFIPAVRRVPVTSQGERCQSVNSDLTLLGRGDISMPLNTDGTPKPDPVFLAWAPIDPGSPVFRVGQSGANSNGLGAQHWGWYQQFLIAYLDGGPIPTADSVVGSATVTRMVFQPLYFPRSGVTPAAGNGLGAGNDVVQFVRGESGYSPVCQVFSYTLPAGQPVPTDAATITTGAAAAPASWNLQAGAPVSATGSITPTFIFCLQAR